MPPYIPHDTVALLAKIPAMSVRREDLRELYGRLKILLDRSPRARLLSILKYAAYLVLLINFGSLPLVWHGESLFFSFRLRASPGRMADESGSTRVFLSSSGVLAHTRGSTEDLGIQIQARICLQGGTNACAHRMGCKPLARGRQSIRILCDIQTVGKYVFLVDVQSISMWTQAHALSRYRRYRLVRTAP